MFGDTFDRADEAGIGAQHARQKNRKQRNHFGGDVGEEAHRAQTEDVAAEFRLTVPVEVGATMRGPPNDRRRSSHPHSLYDRCISDDAF